MKIDMTRPKKLYRYSEKKWLDRSLIHGEFRLRPASDYKIVETDLARQDDELVRVSSSPASSVKILDENTGKKINPIGDVTYRSEIHTDYLTICFSTQWDEKLFEEFPGTNACLIVHNVEEFCERFHMEVEKQLPQWAGIDGCVVYGEKSELGVAFSKPLRFFTQQEWRFAWLPDNPMIELKAMTIRIGNIENIAEIIEYTGK